MGPAQRGEVSVGVRGPAADEFTLAGRRRGISVSWWTVLLSPTLVRACRGLACARRGGEERPCAPLCPQVQRWPVEVRERVIKHARGDIPS